MRRLSLRKRKSKPERRQKNTMTTPAQPENTRVSESLSYDSFDSIEWSNDHISPNNNHDYDNPRSSNYQTPTRGLHEESYHDEHYRSPSIVDYYTNEWNRTTTFTPTNEDQNDFTYHEPSGVHYYDNRGNKTSRVSMVAPAGKKQSDLLHQARLFYIKFLHVSWKQHLSKVLGNLTRQC